MKTPGKLVLVAAPVLLLMVAGLFLVRQEEQAIQSDPVTVVVYKSPTCGCCSKWVDHLKEAGFEVEAHDTNDVASVKQHYGVQRSFASCHTALVDGYVVEGHVPAQYVKQLLEERPEIVGLTVPGMPIGSPGMEGPNPEAYDVLSFDEQGQTDVFAHVTP